MTRHLPPPFGDWTLRKVLDDEPSVSTVGALADKSFRDYTPDDWQTVTPLIEESTDLMRRTVDVLAAEIDRIEAERDGNGGDQ